MFICFIFVLTTALERHANLLVAFRAFYGFYDASTFLMFPDWRYRRVILVILKTKARITPRASPPK